MTIDELKKIEAAAHEAPWFDIPNPKWHGAPHLIADRADCPHESTQGLGSAGVHEAALIVALRNHAKALIAVAEAAKDIDERNGSPAHIEYCDWENNDQTECCCGMNELRAALHSLEEV